MLKAEKRGLCFYPYENREPYFIAWERIQSVENILGWIAHLCEKKWFTPSLCAKFIEHCAQHLKITYRPL